MLARIRKAKEENEGGFTLIELLVVVVIIGILAAIAIPTFLSQREKAWQRAAQSDLRNASVLLEEHYSDTGSYAAFDVDTVKTSGEPGEVTVTLGVVDATGYCIEADHARLGATGTVDFYLASADGTVKPGSCPPES